MSNRNPKPVYSGPLAEPLEYAPKALLGGLYPPAEERRLEEVAIKFGLLLDHYGIDRRAPDVWRELCFALVRQHVPGFSEAREKARGRDEFWTWERTTKLFNDVNSLRSKRVSQLAACRILKTRPPYRELGACSVNRLLRVYHDEKTRRKRRDKAMEELQQPGGPLFGFGLDIIGRHFLPPQEHRGLLDAEP